MYFWSHLFILNYKVLYVLYEGQDLCATLNYDDRRVISRGRGRAFNAMYCKVPRSRGVVCITCRYMLHATCYMLHA